MCQDEDSSLPGEKKITAGEDSVLNDQSFGVVLSPELKEKVMENKLTAKMKLTNKQTRGVVQDLGMSWYAALEPEFSKPYFQQVYLYRYIF